MTDRQRNILLIVAGLEEEGKRPTCRAIARQVGISPKAVNDHLKVMTERAYLAAPVDTHSNYSLTHWGRYKLGLPVVSVIRMPARRAAA